MECSDSLRLAMRKSCESLPATKWARGSSMANFCRKEDQQNRQKFRDIEILRTRARSCRRGRTACPGSGITRCRREI